MLQYSTSLLELPVTVWRVRGMKNFGVRINLHYSNPHTIHLILLIVLRQVHSLFQSAFSTQCDLVLPLFSLRSISSCKRLLPRLPVTYIPPSILPSITCFRSQFLRKMWTVQLSYPLVIVCKIFLSYLILHRFLHDLSNKYSPSFSSTIQSHVPNVAFC